MAIPVHLQQFKAAGIYKVVFDKSTVLGVDAEILRLVVGYSEQGPFNIPTYITSVSDFRAIYGGVSKKLEKRGIYFHRMAIQALGAGPILCLNLKKFDGETVDGASINTNFNPTFEAIETVKLRVEDIYDTTRFWELSADKLNNLRAVDGSVMDQYINICTTNTSKTSATYFIRKASGNKLNGYNISVSDWYSDKFDEMPDYLENYRNSMISDFFAEVYVFAGKFTPSQVLASSTLKNYFEIDNYNTDERGLPKLKLRPYVTNAYNDKIDTLDALVNDPASGAIGHYIGSLIPYFKNKQGAYMALDIMFNNDIDIHNMMMSFNTDLLDEMEAGKAYIDLSGRLSISTDDTKTLSVKSLFSGTAVSKLLCNSDSPVIVDKPYYTNNVIKLDGNGKYVATIPFSESPRRVMGTLYVSEILKGEGSASHIIKLMHVGKDIDENSINGYGNGNVIVINCGTELDDLYKTAELLGAAKTYALNKKDEFIAQNIDYREINNRLYVINEEGYGTYWPNTYEQGNAISDLGDNPAFINENGEFIIRGPKRIITAITRIEQTEFDNNTYTDEEGNMKVSFTEVICQENGDQSKDSVYGASVSFLPLTEGWEAVGELDHDPESGAPYLNCTEIYDNSLYTSISVGDCFLANDGEVDWDGDGVEDRPDGFYDNVYVQRKYTIVDDITNEILEYRIVFSGNPFIYNLNKNSEENNTNSYLVRIDKPINQEIGNIYPQYLEGYTYINSKPAGTSMNDKLNWQKFILSTLTEYKGLRIGLINKSDIDYRYIVDTFESYVDEECKSTLSMLAAEKQSAFAILNFPAVKTFIKCPYSSYTNSKGVFDVQYIVDGANKKKPAAVMFSLPSDANGASFCAFYTPLRFTDGYVDTTVPAAGLVSNLFIQKYITRQPYYIIAGPNYGRISTSGLVGPDYKYSQDELNIIEPYGVNCMIYRPGFGTFINANQTAKQSPVSALSKVNVRELVIYLQDEIEKVLQAFQWEFNNSRTRNAILERANSICSNILANGGLQSYLNVMDESNNTNEIIDNEMAVLSTHIEPGMGCGKMVHELTIYRTGQMSASIND